MLRVHLENQSATERFAEAIGSKMRAGDIIALRGDLGAGKSTFARALLRYLSNDPTLEVPSPTYTLVQPYQTARIESVLHADFYRLGAEEEALELGIDEALFDGAAIIEWPDQGMLPDDASVLTLTLSVVSEDSRTVELSATSQWQPRLERIDEVWRLVKASGFGEHHWSHVQGDASARSYQRLTLDQDRAILLDSPAMADGPSVKDGLPYSKVVHLAEDVKPFIDVATWLTSAGFSAPKILAKNEEMGLAIIEDLGGEGVTVGDPPRLNLPRYCEAARLLAALHTHQWTDYPSRHKPEAYSNDVFVFEASLLTDWFCDFALGAAPTEDAKRAFEKSWHSTLDAMPQESAVLVMRDFHSPNLLWLPEREGIARVGLLDFQDALLGPATYDLASLTQDARILVTAEEEQEMLAAYRGAAGLNARAYASCLHSHAVMGAQRASKVLGIFVRLFVRDHKPGYLKHLPRMVDVLARNLEHPALAPVNAWHETHLPLDRMRQAAENHA